MALDSSPISSQVLNLRSQDIAKSSRKRKLGDGDDDVSAKDPLDEITSEADRIIFQDREKELRRALIGGKEQTVRVTHVIAEIATTKVVVRDIIPEHVDELVDLMKICIVKRLLYFRCIVETGQDTNTKDEIVVKKIMEKIETGTRKVFFLSGIHRFKAIQKVQPNHEVRIDIYDAKEIVWSTGQYIATRDNRMSHTLIH